MQKNLLVAAMLLCFCCSYAQKAEEALQKLYKEYPQEKVILALTKKDYLAGETIFFKSYVFSGYDISLISTNVYVELYDRNKVVVHKAIVPIYKGAGEGSIALTAAMAEDVYFLRAYTQWMLNFDEKLNYFEPVNIYNPYSSKKLVPKTVSWSPYVFPESGILLSEVPSRMAIRLSTEGSLPASWKATLLNKAGGQPVASANSLNPQIGVIDFIPASGHEYILRVTDDAGTVKEVAVPAVQEEGTLLQVNSRPGKIAYRISFKNKPGSGIGYSIIGTIHDEVVFKGNIKKSTGVVNGTIETKDLPAGVLRLTVFDEKENPLAERLCFVDPLQLKIAEPSLRFDSLSFDAKGVNLLQVDLDSLSWNSYTLQVLDANYPKPVNFLSSLYLNSDFASWIYDPSWYFEQLNQEKADALDALLMTEHWQRFQWKEVLSGKLPQIKFRPDRYLSFKATVTRRKKMEAIKDLNLLIQTKSDGLIMTQVKLDTGGVFYLENMAFVDSLRAYYQLNSKKYAARDIEVSFEALNKFNPTRRALPFTAYTLRARNAQDSVPAHITRARETYNNNRLINEKSKMMEEVIIRYRKKTASQELDEQLSTGLFSGTDAMIFDFVNKDQISATSYTNILHWLQGRVPGLTLSNATGAPVPYMRGLTPAAIFVDEMRVEPDFVGSISIQEIAMIKVIRGLFLGSAFGGDGAIAIYTKRGNMGNRSSGPDLPNSYLAGYKQQPKFFMPDYSNEFFKSIADKREILDYRHLLVPDENSKASVRFYNNDISKAFRIIITGFTADGRPVYLDKVVAGKN